MIFGQKVTTYEIFLTGTYGYVLRLLTAPTIKNILSLQVKNNTLISSVIENPTSLNDLMMYSEDVNSSDFAYAVESGIIYIYLKTSKYPYEDNTQFLLRAYRYPVELIDLESELDISPGDLELFLTLSISIAAEMQGKMIPQRTLDKIEYLKNVINMEQS